MTVKKTIRKPILEGHQFPRMLQAYRTMDARDRLQMLFKLYMQEIQIAHDALTHDPDVTGAGSRQDMYRFAVNSMRTFEECLTNDALYDHKAVPTIPYDRQLEDFMFQVGKEGI